MLRRSARAASSLGCPAVAAALLVFAAGCDDAGGEAHAAPAVVKPSAEAVPASAPAVAPVVASAAPEASAAPAGATVIRVSAVGDCTLGSNWDSPRAPGSFHREMEARGNDWRYPFSGVRDLLADDDLTIANLETTLTREPTRQNAPFAFRGEPEFARILAEGSVELVNVANNHSNDAGPHGYAETLDAVRSVGVTPFGNGIVDVRTVKGIEIVNLGYLGGPEGTREKVMRDVARYKRADNLVFVSFHWGIEGSHEVNGDQLRVGRGAVDAGADLVIGTHPHVLQAIEDYKGKRILYSLGNFVFGGHSQPDTLDSMIYRERFTVEGGRVVERAYEIVPVAISSVRDHNDFRPVVLSGVERDRVLADVASYRRFVPPPR